ncbi:hypothetical protein [Aeoliella sp. SH292]|uniref:hypothetical protein n=1 Tax=Aeoliella sp. SH292 TaxID=3454464 RepID=UPI003F97D8B1
MFALQLHTENLLYLVLYLVTLVLHVVAMNYVVAGAIVVAGAGVWRLFGSYCDATGTIVAVLKDWLPFALGVTITLGVAPILFIQLLYKHPFYTANLLLFHRWMSILPVLIVAFYLLYLQKSKWIEHRGQLLRTSVGLGVVAMFLFVAWSWSENHLLSLASQQTWTDHYAAGRMWYATPELAPRLSLFLIASFTNLALLLAWQLRGRATTTIVHRLALFAGVGVVGSLAVAAWYWFAVPEVVRSEILKPGNQLILVAAVAGVVVYGVAWAWMAHRGRIPRQMLWLITFALTLATCSAALLREIRRYVALVEVDHWQSAVDATQESARLGGLGVFLFFAVLNAAAIAWVFKLVQNRPTEASGARKGRGGPKGE